jgi:ParE toxin of type II toxin-antitoxin system, parDE
MAERKSIVWSDIARNQFKKVNQYYYDNTRNTLFCEKLKKETDHTLLLVSKNNLLGKSIPKTKLRSIVVYSYAIIYEIKEKHIFIALFWDTHRNPEILKILLNELY